MLKNVYEGLNAQKCVMCMLLKSVYEGIKISEAVTGKGGRRVGKSVRRPMWDPRGAEGRDPTTLLQTLKPSN